MKKIVIFSLVLFVSLSAVAQSKFNGFLKPVTTTSLKAYEGTKDLKGGSWLFRWDMGMTGTVNYLQLNEEGKVTGLQPAVGLSKLTSGIFYQHFRADAVPDWAAGAMITVPTSEGGRYGVALAGAYSIFTVGVLYDFGVPLKQGIGIMTSVKIDLFNNIQ